ncbi:MAG: diguanylate cyclase [Clostridia bacterium]|nr:diguanylate cyclase [Clostridia bacterium]
MSEDFYKRLIEQSPVGYAYHKIVCDKAGRPCDYIFVEVNAAFEELTGLKSKDIVGKTISKVQPGIKKGEFDWISCYGDVALMGERKEFEQYSEPLGKWFKVNAYSPELGYFVTLFLDVTPERSQLQTFKALSNMSEELLYCIGEESSYQKITEDFLALSDAKFAAFNLYDEDGTHYTTMAIAGERSIISRAISIMDLSLQGKKWLHDPVRADKIKDHMVTHFATLHDLSGDVIPKFICDLLTKSFSLGETVLVKITKENKMLGDFTLIMPKGKSFNKDSVAEIFSRQLGLTIIQKRTDEKLRNSESRHKAMVAGISDVIAIAKPNGTIKYVSPNIEKFFGWAHDEMIGKNGWETVHPDDLEWVKTELHKVVKENDATLIIRYRFKCKDETYKWIKLVVTNFINNEAIGGFLLNFHDITEFRQKQKQIEFLSYNDLLTGLFNRRYYEKEILKLDHKDHYPLALIMADVNGLKLTNDAFGHKAGDMLLRKVANILKGECRERDMIARIGGDEFVILLPNTDATDTESIIYRINTAIKKEESDHTILSISLGYAVKKDTSETIDEIFMKAEDDMYRHKLSESTSMRSKTIDLIMNTLFEKNNREMLHSERVSAICKSIAESMGFTSDEVNEIRLSGLMHDIGKIGVIDSILNDSEGLSAYDLNEVQRHSEIGYRILSSANEFSQIANYVLEHHEKWDGTGYPRALKGKEISLQARIIAVADAYDAMTKDRTYKQALSKQEAMAELRRCSGTQFDPEVVTVFLEKVLKCNDQ